jgi:HEPN domain-containing protein
MRSAFLIFRRYMDQLREKNEVQDIRELLTEILKVQEMILRRVERLEEALVQSRPK